MNEITETYQSDLKTEPLKRLFWKYTMPTILSLIVNGLYTMVDGFFVGRYVGTHALASINLLWPLYALVFGIGGMVGMAGSSLFSIEKGKGNYVLARQYLANGFLLTFILSVPLSLLFAFASEKFICMQITDEPLVVKAGLDYMKVMAPSAFFSISSVALCLFIRNDDRPKLATCLSIICAFINIFFDYIFIKCFGWGMTGAALATVLAQTTGAVYGIYYFFSKRANLRLQWIDLRFSKEKSFKIILLGVSSLMMCFYYGFITACYNWSFAKYGGALNVAAFSIVGYIGYMYYLFGEGFSAGVQPILSYNYGAKRYYNIRRLMGRTTRILFYLYLIFMIFVYGIPYQLVGLFTKNDTDLINAAVLGLKLNLFTCVLEVLILLGISYFQSVDKARQATIVSIVNLFIQVPFIFGLPLIWGIKGIWLAYPLANIPLAMIVFFLVIADMRKNTFELKKEHQKQKEIKYV